MSSQITYDPDSNTNLSNELFDDEGIDDEDIEFSPPSIRRETTPNNIGAMHDRRLFGDKTRALKPGGRRRKKSRKKKRRKSSTGRSSKKKTRKTATVHKFEIVKRNPLTIKIFEKKGKKWVLIETHVSQKGGVGTRSHKKSATRFKSAQLNFFKTKKLEGKAMHDIQKEWVNIVRLKQWSKWIPNNPNPQSAGKRKTKRRKRRRKKQLGVNFKQ